jgi:hypothetical protein
VLDAIPPIVCDTLYAMGLHDQAPSWKIMDNKGRVTVVLHWEKEMSMSGALAMLPPGMHPHLMQPHHHLPALQMMPSRQSSIASSVAGHRSALGALHSRSISQVSTKCTQ